MEKNGKQFTNESLAKKFENNFVLVNYAISLAENMIQSGRDPRVSRQDLQSRAMLVLEEIREGQDRFDPVGTDYKDSFSMKESASQRAGLDLEKSKLAKANVPSDDLGLASFIEEDDEEEDEDEDEDKDEEEQ